MKEERGTWESMGRYNDRCEEKYREAVQRQIDDEAMKRRDRDRLRSWPFPEKTPKEEK